MKVSLNLDSLEWNISLILQLYHFLSFLQLFQWVHRKFRQNSIEPFKDFTFGISTSLSLRCANLLVLTNIFISFATLISGNPCCLTVQPTLDELHHYTNPGFKFTSQSRSLKPNRQESQTSHSEFEDNRDEEKSQEEASTVIPELFQGFLTIGTLGAETVTNEPATPTFTIPRENTFERNAEVTESDLKLINYELGRFLEAEKEEFYESSGRNSHVSAITLGGKQIDAAEDEDYGNTSVCPLQGYLLRSSIELPETVTEVKKERASLAELFHRTKITNQGIIETGETGETQLKQTHRSSKHIMSKLLKKVNTSSKSWNTSENDAKSASTNKKLSKVLRIFHRKVHSESSMNAKTTGSQKGKIKNVLNDCFHGYDTGDPIHPGKGRNFPSECKSEKWSQHGKKRIPPKRGLTNGGSSRKRECWIKTDDECKCFWHAPHLLKHSIIVFLFLFISALL
ncbi:protein LAZY 1-like [Neltuma alba]|uniref:protein LAZY 1-like n=1 Tax=Neltuma alba TaxID=207710 RepID=UPI0010A441FF|nr:protein LAZY 1-like [Prosopis alba]